MESMGPLPTCSGRVSTNAVPRRARSPLWRGHLGPVLALPPPVQWNATTPVSVGRGGQREEELGPVTERTGTETERGSSPGWPPCPPPCVWAQLPGSPVPGTATGRCAVTWQGCGLPREGPTSRVARRHPASQGGTELTEARLPQVPRTRTEPLQRQPVSDPSRVHRHPRVPCVILMPGHVQFSRS